ncbi:putative quinol monooxygenase [Amphritea sp.]|uniref:putative quinol monooxygenase n=1 Tax=Amphritea sp. TaxID=1872502 RepID=UPI0025BB4C05|nr:putative quinol monooxygenase [Amphritea sp.]
MSAPLTIVARIEARLEDVQRVKAELISLIEPTRAEQGCIQYDLHQDNQTPQVFVFYENWESRELWLRHMESEHLKRYSVAIEGAVASFTVNEMNCVR